MLSRYADMLHLYQWMPKLQVRGCGRGKLELRRCVVMVQVLASMSTRRGGKKLQGSVLASLTALTTAVEGLDKNVDYIFEDVFSGDFMRDIVTLDIDDFL